MKFEHACPYIYTCKHVHSRKLFANQKTLGTHTGLTKDALELIMLSERRQTQTSQIYRDRGKRNGCQEMGGTSNGSRFLFRVMKIVRNWLWWWLSD